MRLHYALQHRLLLLLLLLQLLLLLAALHPGRC